MVRFLHSFFLSWTSIITVTVWYWLTKLVFPHLVAFGPRDLSAAYMATYAAFGVLLIAQVCDIIYRTWIRPRGYVLIKEVEYAELLLLRER